MQNKSKEPISLLRCVYFLLAWDLFSFGDDCMHSYVCEKPENVSLVPTPKTF